jgi:hypothetical protein
LGAHEEHVEYADGGRARERHREGAHEPLCRKRLGWPAWHSVAQMTRRPCDKMSMSERSGGMLSAFSIYSFDLFTFAGVKTRPKSPTLAATSAHPAVVGEAAKGAKWAGSKALLAIDSPRHGGAHMSLSTAVAHKHPWALRHENEAPQQQEAHDSEAHTPNKK